jgi:hypothetical protein
MPSVILSVLLKVPWPLAFQVKGQCSRIPLGELLQNSDSSDLSKTPRFHMIKDSMDDLMKIDRTMPLGDFLFFYIWSAVYGGHLPSLVFPKFWIVQELQNVHNLS